MRNLAALALAIAHGLLVASAARLPEWLAPVIAASIYIPLWPLRAAGMPVFGQTTGWGWDGPSLLGWAMLVAFWVVVWWLLVRLAFRAVRSTP